MQGGLYRFSPAEGSFVLLHKVEAHLPENRLNDGHVDVKGHLWFGSMSDKETEVTGSLYRLEVDHEPAIADSGYFSPIIGELSTAPWEVQLQLRNRQKLLAMT
jgi:sugar lactone lactonase YvrE